jgi:hypothetical protein
MDFSRMKRFPVTPRCIAGRSTMMIWAVLLVLAVGRLYAQGGAAGTILGTVTDITGATIANAKVQVTSQDTGVTQEAVTTR